MKAKLLKKLRRRFEIVVYPNGRLYEGVLGNSVFYPEGCVRLEDYEDEYTKSYSLNEYTEEEATQIVKDRIIEIAHMMHTSQSRRNKFKGRKVWHNGYNSSQI